MRNTPPQAPKRVAFRVLECGASRKGDPKQLSMEVVSSIVLGISFTALLLAGYISFITGPLSKGSQNTEANTLSRRSRSCLCAHQVVEHGKSDADVHFCKPYGLKVSGQSGRSQ